MKWIARWFWTPVRENENWAQTLVRVFGNLFRCFVTLVAVAVAVAVAVMWANSALQPAPPPMPADERSQIAVTVLMRSEGANNGVCATEFPLAVSVRNNSSRTLMSMDLLVTAREPGRSTNLLRYDEQTISWDSIVPPDHAQVMCYALRARGTGAVVYSAIPVEYTVRLQATEPWMLRETRAAPMQATAP